MRAIALALSVILLFSVVAFAATTNNASMNMSFSGTTATRRATAAAPGATIEITMELWQGTTKLKEWTKSGTDSVTKTGTHACVSGMTYDLYGTYTIDGVTYDYTSKTKTCP